jgi:hypothetical protein
MKGNERKGPKAVLVYKEHGLQVEGLIFGETSKIVNYENKESRDFEYNYCNECCYYVNYEEDPWGIENFVNGLLSNLSLDKNNWSEKGSEASYERCVMVIREIKGIEDIKDLITTWEAEKDYIFKYCLVDFTNYLGDHYDWLDRVKDRHCPGGWSVVEENNCSEINIDDLGENTEYEIGLPSHIWLKLSNIFHPDSYNYYLLAMISYKGFVMPPLAIGNVWSSLQVFRGDASLGMVCWGDVINSSNIKTAYNQFWGSTFNYDNVGSNINLDKPKEYGNLLLQGIKERVDNDCDLDSNYDNDCDLDSNYRNNIILKDGKFKPGVKIHKL